MEPNEEPCGAAAREVYEEVSPSHTTIVLQSRLFTAPSEQLHLLIL